MLDLTPQELRILRSAGRRQRPAWLIWLPAILGGAGGLGIVVAAAFLRPEPNVRGIAYGFLMTGFLNQSIGFGSRTIRRLLFDRQTARAHKSRREARVRGRGKCCHDVG